MSIDFNPGISVEGPSWARTSPFPRAAPSRPEAPHVRTAEVVVDADRAAGELRRIWESIGYDEINWTYTPTGKRLLQTFAELLAAAATTSARTTSSAPAAASASRTGATATSTTRTPTATRTTTSPSPTRPTTRSSTPATTCWSSSPSPRGTCCPTRRSSWWSRAAPRSTATTRPAPGPTRPRTTPSGAGLVAAHARHCLERYGADEVDSWLWELWNEPDIFYWRGTPEQFYELYSVTAAAVRSVLPNAKVGGPAVTGGGVEFLRGFLAHTSSHGDRAGLRLLPHQGLGVHAVARLRADRRPRPGEAEPVGQQDAVRDPPRC